MFLRFFGLILAVFVLLSGPALANQSFRVFGYLPEYRLQDFNYTAAFSGPLTDLIFFSIEVGPMGAIAHDERLPSKEDIAKARSAAATKNGHLLICVGGANRGGHFASVVSSRLDRNTFAKNLAALIIEMGLDGVDFNWIHPITKSDARGLAKLIQATRRHLGPAAIITLSFDVFAPQSKRLLTAKEMGNVDFMHLMCQGPENAGWWSTPVALELLSDWKVDMSKITVGFLFFGMHSDGDFKAYKDLVDEPWTGSLTKSGYLMDDEATTRQKLFQSIKFGVAGAMIWELGQDVQPTTDPRSRMSFFAKEWPALEKFAREYFSVDEYL